MVTFLAAIFVFGFLIISHEFGHFITAKLSGINVLEFSIGMGPKLFGFKGKETNYSLRLFPIGGYVKMLGEEEESQDPHAFCNQSPWRRLIVIVAGAFMNFLLAIVLFTMVSFNAGILTPIVDQVEPGFPAAKSGIQTGDRITAINDKSIKTWGEFTSYVSQNKEKPMKITVKRNENAMNFIVKPEIDKSQNKYVVGIKATLVKGNFIQSVGEGFKRTYETAGDIFKFLGIALSGRASSEDVGGPIAIIKMSGEVARMGIWNLLLFTALLSVNLGIINLIPFPALDGGWVLILLIEGITGKKIDENKLGVINFIGFALLMALVVFITFKDITKIGWF